MATVCSRHTVWCVVVPARALRTQGGGDATRHRTGEGRRTQMTESEQTAVDVIVKQVLTPHRMMMTCSVRAPWAPRVEIFSMSLLRLGPDTRLTAEGIARPGA